MRSQDYHRDAEGQQDIKILNTDGGGARVPCQQNFDNGKGLLK